MEVKIKQGEEMIDATIEMVDGVMVVSPKVEKYVPKDGDVVYSGGFYDFVFIYKENLTAEAYYYVSLYLNDNKIGLPDGSHIGYVSQLRPATEEEKQRLFDKLAVEGYEWKAETKELIKLKWKPTYGTLYYRPGIRRAEINVISDGWADNDMDKSYYNKGWTFNTYEECDAFCDKLRHAIEGVKP